MKARSRNGHKRHPRAGGEKMPVLSPTRKVIVEFPREVLSRTEAVAAELSTSRSKVIRSAVEEYLNTRLKSELERNLAAGYAANAELDRKICQEFAYVDSENL